MQINGVHRLLVAGVLLGGLLGGCASTPEVYSKVAPGRDFSVVETYGFLPNASTDKAEYQSLETNFLKVAVAQQLDLRGLRYEPVDPDVLMNFYIHTAEKMRTRQTPTTMGGYYGYRGGIYDDFGYDPLVWQTRIEQYTEGTLTIDMVDPKERKLLWEGTVTGRLTKKDVQDMEGTIDAAVRDVFTKFPITAPGAPAAN